MKMRFFCYGEKNMISNILKKRAYLLIVITCVFCCACDQTYKSDYVVDSIKKICKDEYGITNVDIKIKGKTLGVYLPLDQLFSLDYEKFLRGEELGDLENLIQFHPDALDKVEDVLFSTSRVILSTDRKIDFYVVNATDTTVTGIQFTILGYVLDMKRVRFWDISRDEYRKRLIHDLSINKAVLWKRNVIALFEGVAAGKIDEVMKECCVDETSLTTLSPYFHKQLLETFKKDGLNYEIIDIKGKPFQEKEVLVYAKVKETYTPKPEFADQAFQFESGFVGEYLFVLSMLGMEYKIVQVIPFYVVDDDGSVKRIDFPNELKIYENLDEWPNDFEFTEVYLEDFLAEQIGKRLQGEVSLDETIKKNFIVGKQGEAIACSYETAMGTASQPGDRRTGYFSFYLALRLKQKLFLNVNDLSGNKDLLYLIEKVLREFAFVVSAYGFKNYSHVELHLPLLNESLTIEREDIVRFHKKKISLEELLRKA
jgi:hypothetical protein